MQLSNKSSQQPCLE